MPIYEYICPDCKTKFELMRPISRCAEPAECPKCKHQARPGFIQFLLPFQQRIRGHGPDRRWRRRLRRLRRRQLQFLRQLIRL